ncbi:DUF1824 family protein [Vulcanococcus sp.]|jgi:hypothetical protein|uniref:DUF1824 family protein n=1 Tax=Vulcanococcus sp. TaxID=2856995 RepID=UPI0034F93655
MANGLTSLKALCGLRSAPPLSGSEQGALREQLRVAMDPCDWFTIGVMAPSAAAAVAALRACEQALGWDPLELDPSGEALASIEGPVFLKGNQNNGRFLVRREGGLGEGLLITGHSAVTPEAGDTWGPLPLTFFGQSDG